jgi:hypothetical protein
MEDRLKVCGLLGRSYLELKRERTLSLRRSLSTILCKAIRALICTSQKPDDCGNAEESWPCQSERRPFFTVRCHELFCALSCGTPPEVVLRRPSSS